MPIGTPAITAGVLFIAIKTVFIRQESYKFICFHKAFINLTT